VWVALWTDRRAARRIEDEHEFSDQRLKAEHERSDRLLKAEREHSRAEIEEERRLAREREQLAEAYAVQVVPAEVPVRIAGDEEGGKQLAVIIVNRGKFTITRIEAQFSPDGMSLLSHRGYKRLMGFENVSESVRAGWGPSDEGAMSGVLSPWDLGMRFEADTVHVRFLKSWYPVVRWTDRWGTRWEHRCGEVRQVRDHESWSP